MDFVEKCEMCAVILVVAGIAFGLGISQSQPVIHANLLNYTTSYYKCLATPNPYLNSTVNKTYGYNSITVNPTNSVFAFTSKYTFQQFYCQPPNTTEQGPVGYLRKVWLLENNAMKTGNQYNKSCIISGAQQVSEIDKGNLISYNMSKNATTFLLHALKLDSCLNGGTNINNGTICIDGRTGGIINC